MSAIPNYDDAIPKKYRGVSVKTIPELDIKSFFRMLILGPSYSGKTNLVMFILKHSPNVFAHLHVIARNKDQPIYDFLREKLDGFITFYDEPPNVDNVRSTPINSKKVELVIIDDYGADKLLQKNLFSEFFIRGRHHFLSTIFIAHSYFATDKLLRLNSEYVAILNANSKRDLQMVGQILLCDSVKGQIRYNFDRVIDLSQL
ncbi:hypothetical protein PHYSODRAFT_469698 [Phytophthora sojae]|uniref:Uncharacterized protein n=1 Tax=Phytophthora sojae (strain P6497) TaxID=1094619 RepID=G4YE53_PHYSP|nr:hypothetical protein PHYSODRAFT_469698 [Phytophthora sojae]EGZ29634.1 hypothetical protein PHYSODRAFT_469698 [Phytophthora sojae]|eukprot:XP_009516909.1 hypothetical protein PHYSODRAFT_469698 [Phytophthora sojae]